MLCQIGQGNCFGKPTLAQFPALPRNGQLKGGNVPKQPRVAHSSVHNLPHAVILFCIRSVFQNLSGKSTIVSKRLNISINIKIKLDLPQLRFAVAFFCDTRAQFVAILCGSLFVVRTYCAQLMSLSSQNNAQIRHKNTMNTNSIRPDKFSISSTRHCFGWIKF